MVWLGLSVGSYLTAGKLSRNLRFPRKISTISVASYTREINFG
jgi:hypoxanthine-guanine phosphoribosyltransferase